MCCFQYDDTENTLVDGTLPCTSCKNFVACLAGVLTFATCGAMWIATCFICGDAAPGVKIECKPCDGTGFVVRKRRIFVPSNQGMERPQQVSINERMERQRQRRVSATSSLDEWPAYNYGI